MQSMGIVPKEAVLRASPDAGEWSQSCESGSLGDRTKTARNNPTCLGGSGVFRPRAGDMECSEDRVDRQSKLQTSKRNKESCKQILCMTLVSAIVRSSVISKKQFWERA